MVSSFNFVVSTKKIALYSIWQFYTILPHGENYDDDDDGVIPSANYILTEKLGESVETIRSLHVALFLFLLICKKSEVITEICIQEKE